MNLKEIEDNVMPSQRLLGYKEIASSHYDWLISEAKKVKELESDDLYIRGMADADSQDMVDRAKLREENTKLKAERDRYKKLGAVLENKSSNLEVEVEQLHDALKSISKNGCCDTCQEAKLVALEALGEK